MLENRLEVSNRILSMGKGRQMWLYMVIRILILSKDSNASNNPFIVCKNLIDIKLKIFLKQLKHPSLSKKKKMVVSQ